jgi:uncharacterized protein (UPF0371 family)
MATCLSQLYHESKNGKCSGYAKFETFPIWNLPVDHPVNLAYEAATADINDKNMVDTFHLKVYGKRVTNYNRDIESFPILSKLLAKISGNSKIYQSPTDMGVNMAGYAIFDDGVARKAAQNEIIRRYYRALCDAKQGSEPIVTSERIARLMKKHGIDPSTRNVIAMAQKSYENSGRASVAIELDGGRVVCGKTTDLLTCASSSVLNSLKVLAGIEDGVYLLGQNVLEPVCEFKRKIYGDKCVRLNLYDVLSSLALSARTDHLAERAFSKLSELAYAEAHSSHILDSTDLSMLKSLKVNISSEPEYFSN